VQEGFHWKRQCRVAGCGARVLQVRVDRYGQARNDDDVVKINNYLNCQ